MAEWERDKDGYRVHNVPQMQTFGTGATRNDDSAKFDYEGFLNPQVLHAFGKYMHEHRRQRDGSVRASDNWQKGIPFRTYVKSLVRHVLDLWRMDRGYTAINPDTNLPHTKEELCCAILFNVAGYLKELVDPAEINQVDQPQKSCAEPGTILKIDAERVEALKRELEESRQMKAGGLLASGRERMHR